MKKLNQFLPRCWHLVFAAALLFFSFSETSFSYDVSAHCVRLGWTAPGDDGNVGRATTYDIRYSEQIITEQNFESAIQVRFIPTPQEAGTYQEVLIGNLKENTTYYFALRTADEWKNYSQISNVVAVTTTHESCSGQVGNVDCDPMEEVSISDLTALILYLFISNGTTCICELEANVDASLDGNVDIGDMTYLIQYLFLSQGPTLPTCW